MGDSLNNSIHCTNPNRSRTHPFWNRPFQQSNTQHVITNTSYSGRHKLNASGETRLAWLSLTLSLITTVQQSRGRTIFRTHSYLSGPSMADPIYQRSLFQRYSLLGSNAPNTSESIEHCTRLGQRGLVLILILATAWASQTQPEYFSLGDVYMYFASKHYWWTS